MLRRAHGEELRRLTEPAMATYVVDYWDPERARVPLAEPPRPQPGQAGERGAADRNQVMLVGRELVAAAAPQQPADTAS